MGDDFWSLDLDTGEARNLGPRLQLPDPNTGYRCAVTQETDATAQETDTFRLTITDSHTGAETVIDRAVGGFSCPSDSDPTIVVWRRDDARNLTLWTGPYDKIMVVPLDLIVRQTIFVLGNQQTKAAWVFGARPSRPDGLGVFAIDLRDYAITR